MIVSASRRTDIPAFYSDWFFYRLQKGFCTVKNPFNAGMETEISLLPEEVDAFVFWTKNPEAMLPRLDKLDKTSYSYYFLFTLLDYPRDMEPFCPPLNKRIETFIRLSDQIGPKKVIWRYDPIVLTPFLDGTYHRKAFTKISRALSGYTRKCIISMMDVYGKVKRRAPRLSEEHLAYIHKNEGKVLQMLKDLADIGLKHGIRLVSCAENMDLRPAGIEPGKCIDDELISEIRKIPLSLKKDPGQRKKCGCVVSRDIGAYDTCLHGCRYCYAVSGEKRAQKNYNQSRPESASLI